MVCSINNSLSLYSFPVRIWNRRKKGFVQKFRIPTSFRKLLYETGMAVMGIKGDGVVATVPIKIGRLQFPPHAGIHRFRKSMNGLQIDSRGLRTRFGLAG